MDQADNLSAAEAAAAALAKRAIEESLRRNAGEEGSDESNSSSEGGFTDEELDAVITIVVAAALCLCLTLLLCRFLTANNILSALGFDGGVPRGRRVADVNHNNRNGNNGNENNNNVALVNRGEGDRSNNSNTSNSNAASSNNNNTVDAAASNFSAARMNKDFLDGVKRQTSKDLVGWKDADATKLRLKLKISEYAKGCTLSVTLNTADSDVKIYDCAKFVATASKFAIVFVIIMVQSGVDGDRSKSEIGRAVKLLREGGVDVDRVPDHRILSTRTDVGRLAIVRQVNIKGRHFDFDERLVSDLRRFKHDAVVADEYSKYFDELN
jgi:hypothetical protein